MSSHNAFAPGVIQPVQPEWRSISRLLEQWSVHDKIMICSKLIISIVGLQYKYLKKSSA